MYTYSSITDIPLVTNWEFPMLKFLRRALPALVLIFGIGLAGCASNTPVPSGFSGVWAPSDSVVQTYRQNRGGITRAEFKGDNVEVAWAYNDQVVTLTRSPLRQVAAGREQWTGGVTLADGTPATITFDCPVPGPAVRRISCRGTTQGQFRQTSYNLVLNRTN